MEQKVNALPFTDISGRFYMSDGLSADGKTSYRMLSTYIEPETNGALIVASDCKYKRENDQFIQVN